MLWLAAIVALGAALRLWRLESAPPGLFFDVAANLLDAVDVIDGARPIWFPRNNGREPLMIYATAISALWVGATPLAAKIAAAVFGIATIPACYVLGREVGEALGSRAPRRLGLISAFVITTLYWHVNFSRIGLRAIALPLFLALGVGLLLRALRTGSATSAMLGGAVTGVAAYTYLSSRLTPVFLVPALIALWFAGRRPTRLLALYVGAAAVVAAPLARYYLAHRGDLEARAASVSVLNPDVSGGDPIGASLRGALAAGLSTVWRGTPSGMENLPNRPLFEPVTAAMFALGCVVVAVGLMSAEPRRRAIGLLLLLWLAVMIAPAALSVDPPNFSRITGAIAVCAVLAAIGYERLVGWTRPAAALLLAVPLLWTSYDYFVVWAPSESAYRYMMEDKVQGAARVERWLAAGERVFLPQLYARDWTYLFLLRDDAVESFDVGATQVIPAQGTARYVFPPDDSAGLTTVASRVGASQLETFADTSGRFPLLSTLVVARAPGPVATPLGRFEDGIELVDAEPREAHARPGGAVRLRLGWRASGRQIGEYTVFVHGRDAANQTRFQRDRRPGDGSVPSTTWRVGDRVDDYLDIATPAQLPAGEYRIVVGLYDAGSGRRLELPEVAGRPNELAVMRLTVAQ